MVFGFAFDGKETDENGQGTHTAGIAGSTTFGVAKGANIIAVKVMAQGRSSAGLINGFHWMVERHNRRKYLPGFRGSVASMSLANKVPSDPLDYLVKYASAAGIHFAVAAGNDNQGACMTSPGRASRESDIVTVGSINVSDQRSIFSNFGPCVTLYAPGEIIVSTGIGRPPPPRSTLVPQWPVPTSRALWRSSSPRILHSSLILLR